MLLYSMEYDPFFLDETMLVILGVCMTRTVPLRVFRSHHLLVFYFISTIRVDLSYRYFRPSQTCVGVRGGTYHHHHHLPNAESPDTSRDDTIIRIEYGSRCWFSDTVNTGSAEGTDR